MPSHQLKQSGNIIQWLTLKFKFISESFISGLRYCSRSQVKQTAWAPVRRRLMMIVYCQDIIKVRKWISHIALTPNLIPLKLFLDIVPGRSSQNVARTQTCTLSLSKIPFVPPVHREPSHPFRTNYLNRACFVFCGRHFEFLIRARGKLHGWLVRGLEPRLRKLLGDLISADFDAKFPSKYFNPFVVVSSWRPLFPN